MFLSLSHHHILMSSYKYSGYLFTNLSPVITCGSRATKQYFKQSRQNLSEHPRGVGNNNLPDVQRRLTHLQHHIRPSNVKTGEHALASFCTQHGLNGLQKNTDASRMKLPSSLRPSEIHLLSFHGSKIIIFPAVRTHFASDSRHLVQ